VTAYECGLQEFGRTASYGSIRSLSPERFGTDAKDVISNRNRFCCVKSRGFWPKLTLFPKVRGLEIHLLCYDRELHLK